MLRIEENWKKNITTIIVIIIVNNFLKKILFYQLWSNKFHIIINVINIIICSLNIIIFILNIFIFNFIECFKKYYYLY
jgi:hypothetical protein